MNREKRLIFRPIIILLFEILVLVILVFTNIYPRICLPKAVIPTENLSFGDTKKDLISLHGEPVIQPPCDITGEIDWVYFDVNIMDKNMICTYSFMNDEHFNSITYSTDYDDYDKDEFFESAIEYFENNLTSDFVVNNEYCDEYKYEFAYDTGAGGEYITIYADDGCGGIQIYFQY
ncbi:MAG: hypothetical protein ACLUFN_03700 [Eubacterium sp.]